MALHSICHTHLKWRDSRALREDNIMKLFRRLFAFLTALSLTSALITPAWATPYASNVVMTGTTVTFTLNEPTDALKYSINGGALQTLDGTTKGTKTFNLGAASDTFSITAEKNAAIGYLIPTGATIPTTDPGSLNAVTPASGLNLISSDTDKYSWYSNPRGVGVSTNPNAPNFGNVYIAQGNNTATVAPPTGPGARPLGDGIYALHSDQSDAYGYDDTAQNPNAQDGFASFSTASTNSPYRIHVASTGEVYVADFADVNSNLFVLSPNLLQSQFIFKGISGTSPVPAGQNHGSLISAAVTGSLATNDLVVYTLDEDLTTNAVTGAGSTTDGFSVWKYSLSGPLPAVGFDTMPVKAATALSPNAGNTFSDMDRGADGKIYLSVNPSAANPSTTRLQVRDPSDNLLFDSLTASQALGNATDIIANLNQIAISPDQKWLAGMLNFSDVLVLPLENGIPNLANRLIVDAGNVNSARDITFDAANNIHLVSSGQALYRVLSPGGNTKTTLDWNGTSYSFTNQTISAGVAGDYNGNGVVDAADYIVWRNGGPLQNEVSGVTPGSVTPEDYDAWRARFGNNSGSGSGSAVPEPAAAVLLLVASAFGTCARRRSA
jgi:hypothetical protein